MITTAILSLALTLGSAAAQEPEAQTDQVEAEASGGNPALEEAMARIARLEARLDEAEARFREADDWRALDGPVSASSATGGIVVEAGETVREAVAFGGPVVVHGRVRGPAVSFGGDVLVHDGARVEGDAVSFGGRVRVQEGGAVGGDRVAFGPAATGALLPSLVNPSGFGRGLARRLVLLLTFAGAGVLMVALFPAHVDAIARSLRERPFRSGLAGAIVTGLALLLSITLTLTLLGIPVALLVLALLALAWILGFIGLCQAVGDNLPIRGVGARRWTAFLFGVLAVAFAGYLPAVGQVLLLALGLFGAGAAIQTRLGTRELA